MKLNKAIIGLLTTIGIGIVFVLAVFLLQRNFTPNLEPLSSDIVSMRYMEFASGKYAGEAVLDRIQGDGAFYFDTGEIYVGSLVDNEMSGKGKFVYSTGIYEGKFENSQRNDKGTFMWNDGAKYVGLWSEDKMQGKGKLTTGDIIYDGNFSDNKFTDGTIKIEYNNNSYDIKVAQGKIEEIKIKFPGVGEYNGALSGGKRNGQGTFIWNNDRMYVGYWKDDLMHGTGTYYLNSNEYITGEFVNGTLDGKYVYHNSNGNYNTIWENNKCIKVEKK